MQVQQASEAMQHRAHNLKAMSDQLGAEPPCAKGKRVNVIKHKS
jgi:hypothetical protein